ncbi:MAG: sulfatase [bacterium]
MLLTRRQLIALSAAAPVLAQRKSAPPPNIVLIVARDLGAWMLGCYGNKEIRTPNIDFLARTGTRFLNHSVCAPAASAGFATLLTGRAPRQHGIAGNLGEGGQKEIPAQFANEVTISGALSARGYNCGLVGVWGLGDDRAPGHSFKFWHTMTGGGYNDPSISRNGDITTERGYAPELFTRAAVDFIGRQKEGQPFFLLVSHLNARPPYDGHPQKYYDMYASTTFNTSGWEPAAANASGGREYLRDIIGNLRRAAAGVAALDDQIPPLLEALDKAKLRDNTLIVFTSTNGVLLGRHGLWGDGTASFPDNMYEEVMVAPLIWNWFGKVPPEAERPELVSAYDLLPSLCEAAGAPAPSGRNLCGASYMQLAANRPLPRGGEWRNRAFGQIGDAEMARDGRYKLVLRRGGQGPNELFDLRADPSERTNQYDNPEYVSVKDRLTAELAAWRNQHGK